MRGTWLKGQVGTRHSGTTTCPPAPPHPRLRALLPARIPRSPWGAALSRDGLYFRSGLAPLSTAARAAKTRKDRERLDWGPPARVDSGRNRKARLGPRPRLRVPEGVAAGGHAHFRPAGRPVPACWAGAAAGAGRGRRRRACRGSARRGDMRGAASASGSAGACGQGSTPRRGAPRTKPGTSRDRTAGTPAPFARPARGRPRARNGLPSKGQRASVTAGPANRGEGDRWPGRGGETGTNPSPRVRGKVGSWGWGPPGARVLVNGVHGPRGLWIRGLHRGREAQPESEHQSAVQGRT